MATDCYMAFQQYSAGGAWLDAESQVDFSKIKQPLMDTPTKLTQGKIFEVDDFSFDIEQTLNIGSQGSGAGAGKVTFNPFSITRKTDRASPLLFEMACSGTPFETVVLALAKSAGGTTTGSVSSAAGLIFLRFDFKLVAVKTISWSRAAESPKEEVTFEYGALQIRYLQQDPSGKPLAAPIAGGWNRVRNVEDTSSAPLPEA
jgi:type VI secretion system secreted protein Hcp